MPSKKNLSDTDKVNAWMEQFQHPLKDGVELIRSILKKSDKRIGERIKWNAPSYYHQQDMVTFGPAKENKLLLVFHHPFIVNITSDLLEGEYKDRRLIYFDSMQSIKTNKKELTRIMQELVGMIDNGA